MLPAATPFSRPRPRQCNTGCDQRQKLWPHLSLSRSDEIDELDEIDENTVHAPFQACECSVSPKASLYPSNPTGRRSAPSGARKVALSGKAAKIDSSLKGRAGRHARGANLRHQLLAKIVTVAADHVEHIDDALVPRVLKQLNSAHTLEEALRITFGNDERPRAVLPELQSEIPAGNQAALQRARARAIAAKVDLLKRADMLTGAQLGERLGLTRATVDKRRTEGKLLALDFGTKRGFRYPAWQGDLVQDADTRAAYEQVLRSLGGEGAWSRYRFLTQAAPALRGESPTEALRAGRREEVLRAAQTWAAGEQGGG